MDTFDSMQSAEDTVTIVNPGQRYNDVGLHDVECHAPAMAMLWAAAHMYPQ